MRVGASGAAALAIVVLAGCAPDRRPLARATAADRRIEAAEREIQAQDRELRRQRTEIEALRARTEAETQRAVDELED